MFLLGAMLTFHRAEIDPEFLEELKKVYLIKSPFEDKVVELFQYDDVTGFYAFPWSAFKYFIRKCEVRVSDGGRTFRADAPEFIPREGQEEAIRSVVNFLKAGKEERGFAGGVLCAGCGKGKTVMASKIILEMGVPTCVLVHKEFLEEQWFKELKETLRSNVSVGVYRGKKKNTGKTHDIVIASVQSLTSPKSKIPEGFAESFGLLVADEVHRYGAEVWQTAIWKFPTMFRLGLTATPNRFDGMWPVISGNIGPTVYELDSEDLPNSVYLVKLETPLNRSEWDHSWGKEEHKRAALLSLLAVHSGRNLAIAKQIVAAFKKGRRVMVLSSRKIQLRTLSELVVKDGVSESDIGMLIGGLKKVEREEAQSKQLIFSTYSMSNEGLDIPTLDTMFLALPQSDIRQAVGRLFRDCAGKSKLITVDFIDSTVRELVGQAYKRLALYRDMGCEVHGTIE
jgi:superfamily II DNA or RNA helicase